MITPPKTLWLTVKLAKSKTLEIEDGRQAVKGTNNFLYSKHLINEMVNLTIIWRLSVIKCI